MRVSVAIVLLYLPVTDCQCVDVLHNEKQCMPARDHFKSNETALGCMGLCLSQNDNRCKYVQWNVKTKGCFVSPRILRHSSIGDCITIKKRSCNQIYDSVCFEPTSGNVYEGNGELTGLTQEEECKTLCMFMESCQAYTWFATTSRCRIHRATMQSGEKLQTGDKQAMKLSKCPAGRCVTLRASTFSYSGKDEQLTSIGECMKSSLNTTAVAKVDWNFSDESCWSHTNIHSGGVVSDDDKIIQVLKANQCKMTSLGVCMKKRKHAGMSDGYKIAWVNEEDCVSLCYLVSNCAAVELGGNDCVFHFVKKEIKQKKDHTLYVAHDCSNQAELTSVPTTSMATSPTTTVMSSDARQNAEGKFRWSYYTRQTGHTEKAMRRTCLECALLCQRVNCTGFSCEENINDEGCNVNVKGDPMFSPIRLHLNSLESKKKTKVVNSICWGFKGGSMMSILDIQVLVVTIGYLQMNKNLLRTHWDD